MLRAMYDIFGPTRPWLGLVDAVGVALAFLIWNAARDAGARTRAVVSAAGAALLAYALSGSAATVMTLASELGLRGVADWALQDVVTHVLLVAGVAAGVYAVFALRRRAAEAAEDLAGDALVEGDDDEPDAYTTSRQRLVGFASWVDVGAVALALAMPVHPRGPFGGGVDISPGSVTAAAIALHVVSGLILAGALLVLTSRDDLADVRRVGGLFALVAAGVAVRLALPEALATRYWAAFAGGVMVGLMAAAALGLLARAVPADRGAIAYGVLAAIALIALNVAMTARVATTHGEQQLESPVEFGEFPVP